jgi:hypothetical protein
MLSVSFGHKVITLRNAYCFNYTKNLQPQKNVGFDSVIIQLM